MDDTIPDAVDLMVEDGDTGGTYACFNLVAEMTRKV